MTAAVPTDEIYERYLRKAIGEINELQAELLALADETHVPVLGSGHPLGDLRRLRRVLEQEDVAQRVPGSEHGYVRLVGEGEELGLELVDLADRLAQIAFVDLVSGHGSSHREAALKLLP
jgi:hypothetical protein